MARPLLTPSLDREIVDMQRRIVELERSSLRSYGALSSGDTWKEPLPFATGWGNRDTPPSGFDQCTYSKVGNLVVVQGLATKSSGIPASGDTIATLPDGFRPSGSHTFVQRMTNAAGGTQIGWVDINSSGTVTVFPQGTAVETDFVSLSGITFVSTI